MELNRIIYGAWAVLLLGAVCIAAYNLKPRTAELQADSEIGEPGNINAPTTETMQSKVEPTEFLQDKAPGRLPVVSDTDPLADAKVKALRRIVKEEMPGASADEVKIWTDEFKDLPEDAVRFLLKQKRQSDGIPSIVIPDPAQQPAAVDPPNSDSLAETLSRIKQITVRNLMNQHTFGYRRQSAEFFGTANGIRIAELRTRAVSPKPVLTEQPFDFVPRNGYFAVTEDGQTWFTKAGRFTADADGRLSLRIGDRSLLVDGLAALPEGTTSISVSDSGELMAKGTGDETSLGQFRVATFLDATRLNTEDGCLLTPTDASGPPSFQKQPSVWQGGLEPSNVDSTEEQQLLERIAEWSALLGLPR